MIFSVYIRFLLFFIICLLIIIIIITIIIIIIIIIITIILLFYFLTEPFDGNNVAKSVCSLESFNKIQMKFRLVSTD